MSETDDQALDLAGVKQRFLDAEEQLRELAQAAVNLTQGSVQLKRARMGVADASKVLQETGETFQQCLTVLSDVCERLGAAAGVLEQTDLSAILSGVEGLDARLAATEATLVDVTTESRQAVEQRLADAEERSDRRLDDRTTAVESRVGKELEALDAALTRRLRDVTEALARTRSALGEAVTEAERSVGEAVAAAERSMGSRLDQATAAVTELVVRKAATIGRERRRLQTTVWVLIGLQALALAALVYLLIRSLP